MPGRVSSLYGSRCFLSLSEDRGGVLFANVCAGFIRFCYGVCGCVALPRDSCCSQGSCSSGSAGLHPCVRGTGATQACLSLDTPFGRRSAGALSSWFSRSSPDNASSCGRIGDSRKYCWTLLKMPVLMRFPSLHDYDACGVSWNKGAFGENCMQKQCRPLFPLHYFFCFVETIFIGSVVSFHGIFGLGGRDILDLIVRVLRLRSSMSVVG